MDDLMLSQDWKVEKVWRWNSPSHINTQEILSAERLMKQGAICRPSTCFPVLMDSNVGLSALVKGTSPSRGLRRSLRSPFFHFGPTRWLPADHPTRDHPLPTTCASLLPCNCPGLWPQETCLDLVQTDSVAAWKLSSLVL